MSISKKMRFEVFKRDKFTCQYCGASAPTVLLEADHIKPRISRGEDKILNLITSCFDCNRGKGKRELSDDSVVTLQKKQLDELQERREQLEMILKWKEQLDGFNDELEDSLAATWARLCRGFSLNDSGRVGLRKLMRRFQIDEILNAMKIAADHYLKLNSEGNPTQESVETAWRRVGGICTMNRLKTTDPDLAELYYIRGILRHRVYVNEGYIMTLLREATANGVSIEEIKRLATTAKNWTYFRETLEERMSSPE